MKPLCYITPARTGANYVYGLRRDYYPGHSHVCGNAYRPAYIIGAIDAPDLIPLGGTIVDEKFTSARFAHNRCIHRYTEAA